MGVGRFSTNDWKAYSTTNMYDSKTTAQIFTNTTGTVKEFDPGDISMRESRDSTINPNSTAIILGVDVTGSMGMLADVLVRKGVPSLLEGIYTRKPVSDPHVLCMAIGDIECDTSPLQVTQFEADLKIITQLEKIYLEGGGGGNEYESYALAWMFAALKTNIDCFNKRNKKGYLFTIGDECPTLALNKNDKLMKFFGEQLPLGNSFSSEDILTLVSRQWEVFHLMVEEGSYYKRCGAKVSSEWTRLLGQRAIPLSDHTKLSEVILSTIQVNEGMSADDVAKSWDGATSAVVKRAVGGMKKHSIDTNDFGIVNI